jgi:hypothetical protein
MNRDGAIPVTYCFLVLEPSAATDQQSSESTADSESAEDQWQRLLDASPSTGTTTHAVTFRKRWNSMSNPVLVECADHKEYVLKGLQPNHGNPAQLARAIVTEAVVARVAVSLGAPVPAAILVELGSELVQAEPQLQHMAPGACHATELCLNCTERESIGHVAENRQAFARLAVLYGLFVAADHQMIYDVDPPYAVHSVDHGLFIGDTWTIATLLTLPPPAIDAVISSACSFSADELGAAGNHLAAITDEAIASAVAAPPDAWGIAQVERLALAAKLAERRDMLSELLLRDDHGGQ